MGAYDYLELRGINTVLICPRSLKAVVGKKTDESDSSVLANMYRVGFFEPSYVPPRHIRELRGLTRRLEKITKRTSSVKRNDMVFPEMSPNGCETMRSDADGLQSGRGCILPRRERR